MEQKKKKTKGNLDADQAMCMYCVRLISRGEVRHFHALYDSYQNEFLV
jgi:hypothetical protein